MATKQSLSDKQYANYTDANSLVTSNDISKVWDIPQYRYTGELVTVSSAEAKGPVSR